MAARVGVAAPARTLAFDLGFGERSHRRERWARSVVEFRRRGISETRDRHDPCGHRRHPSGESRARREPMRFDDVRSEAAQTEGSETQHEAERCELGHGSTEGRAGLKRLQDRSGFHWHYAVAEGSDDCDADERAEGTWKPRSRCCFHDRLIAVFVPSSARRHRRFGLRRLYRTWMQPPLPMDSPAFDGQITDALLRAQERGDESPPARDETPCWGANERGWAPGLRLEETHAGRLRRCGHAPNWDILDRNTLAGEKQGMKSMLRISRYVVVVGVMGCLVMFWAVMIYAGVAVGSAVLQLLHGGVSKDDIAAALLYAFKILDLFLLATILYIVALGLAALFLDSADALPRWLRIHELYDLKVVLSQSVVVVLLIAFLGDVLEWENGSDIAFVGGGIAMVIAAIAFMWRSERAGGRNPKS